MALAAAATAGLTSRQVLELVAAAAATLTGEATVHLWLVDDDGQHLRLAAEHGARPGRKGSRLPTVLRMNQGLAGTIAHRREPLVISSVRRDRRLATSEWIRDQGLVSFAGVPFARADRVLGVLCLFTSRWHRFTRREVNLLRSFAAHAAVAIENAALFDAATSRLRRLETLREIEREISQQRDPEALLGLISRRATELLAADSATVYLLDEPTGRLRARGSFNAGSAIRDVDLPLGEGLAGAVAVRREGMIVNDYPRSTYAISPVPDRAWAVLAQPLLHGEALHGVILVRRLAIGRPFSQADLVQLGDFAVQASIALENARLLRLASARAERVKAAAEVGQLLASTRDADRILDVIAEKCREILGAEGFGLFRFEPSGGLRYVRGFGLDRDFMREHVLVVGEGVVGKAAAERRSVATADVLHDPAITLSPMSRRRVERQGSRALVAVPLLIHEEVLGVLAVYHPVGFRIPADEAEFLETLANHAATALENARLFAETQRRQESAETLAAITQTLAGSLDLRTVTSLVAEAIRRLLGSEGGAIGLTAPDGTIRLSARVGLGADAFRDVVVHPGEGVTGRVLERGEPFWTNDYASDPRITPAFADQVRAAGITSVLAVPVRLRDETVGVLCGFHGRPVQISSDDITLASDLAQVVAVAVANARLYEEARQREKEARALFEVGRLISATLDPERVFELIVEKVLDLMGVRACGIFRLDEDSVLRYVRGAGLSSAFVQTLAIPLGEGTSGRSVSERTSVWTTDLLADPTIPLNPTACRLVEQEGYRAVLSVPILIQGSPFGCLATYWWEPHVPSPDEVETLSSLATLVAVAIENTRLYGEARRHVARLETLNQINRAVSASLRLDAVLGEIATAAGTFFGASLATLWMADEERRTLIRQAGYGDAEILERIPTRLVYGQVGAGWVAEHREPLLDVSVESDHRMFGWEWIAPLGIRTLSAFPVLLGSRLLGVLAIGWGGKTALSGADLTLLQTLMGQAAIAIENARLYEEARSHEAEAVGLAETSRVFSATLRREAILVGLAEAACRLIGATWSVHTVDPKTRELRVAAVMHPGSPGAMPPSARDAAPTESRQTLAQGVVTTGAPLHLRRVDDLPAGDPARRELEGLGIRSAVLVPVGTGGVVRAVLAGSTHEGSRQFAERDVRLAQAIADRAGIALENARLFEELTQAYQDIKTAQEQLVRTEKLRALGEMASGVAHDFNNLLAAILGRVQLIQRRVEDPKLKEWLDIIEQAALDGAQTVRQIQEFTRVRRDQPTQTVDLNQAVRDAVEITRTRWQSETQSRGLDVQVFLRLDPVPAVDGHPAELREAFTNLLLNAVDALPQGGTITLTTRRVEGSTEVSVADTGVGMSESVRRRIFEPFFSTKGPKGTGLGLAMVYGIVSRHGGDIAVESREGKGSTFTIRLPIGREQPTARAFSPTLSSDSAVRVLVIDDEDHVREILADMLRVEHHQVVVADRGVEGLERFRREAFDLVMTDLAMPGMSGWQVAQAIKALRPEVPVVLVTGWGVEVPADELRASGVDRVMAKPFRFQDVKEILASFRSHTPQQG